MKQLLLIMGAPRSSTTALHNAFIETGLFNGILGVDDLDRDPVIDRNFYTDEYYPTLYASIAATVSENSDMKDVHGGHLVSEVSALQRAFPSPNGLMLKAPHYVFGLTAFDKHFGPHLRVIFTHRSPFSVASSMLRHPHISKQLPRTILECTDFLDQFDLIKAYGIPEAASFAFDYWTELTLYERALFVWHLYATAFIRNVGGTSAFILKNETFNSDYAERLGLFIGLDPEAGKSIQQYYKALPRPTISPSSLSKLGFALWDRIKPTDDALSALS